MPDFSCEEAMSGARVCGIDEVGRGPLAGPVVAACVFIPEGRRTDPFIQHIQDSKKLSKPKLAHTRTWIEEHCIYGIGMASVEEIDTRNILNASLLAMERSLAATGELFNHALIDGNRIPANLPCPATAVIKGDSRSRSIAAASILAKTTRDALMTDLAKAHPHYGWERNAAYPTREHLIAITQHGITPHHRKSFGPVKKHLSL